MKPAEHSPINWNYWGIMDSIGLQGESFLVEILAVSAPLHFQRAEMLV